jgi:hypothetical protein
MSDLATECKEKLPPRKAKLNAMRAIRCMKYVQHIKPRPRYHAPSMSDEDLINGELHSIYISASSH